MNRPAVAYSLTLASSSTPRHESFVARTHDDEDETEVVLKSTSGTAVMLDCWMAALDSRAMATRYRVLMPTVPWPTNLWDGLEAPLSHAQ